MLALRRQSFGAIDPVLHASLCPFLRVVRRDDGRRTRAADGESRKRRGPRLDRVAARMAAEIAAVFYLRWALAFAEWDYAEAYWEHCQRMGAFYLMTIGGRR